MRELQVVELATGQIVKRLDVTGKSDHLVEKTEMGLLRNMNLELFSVRDTKHEPAEDCPKDLGPAHKTRVNPHD